MIRKSRFLAATSLVLIGVLAASTYFMTHRSHGNPDFPSGNPGIEVIVNVPTGASGLDIARALFAKGVVKSSGAFFSRAVSDSRASQIAPGAHRLNSHISAKEALNQLLDTKRITNLIRVPEGAWTDEIFAQLMAQNFSEITVDKALRGLKFPAGFGINGVYPTGDTGLEGIFFPAQYSFGVGTSSLVALQAMTDRFALESVSSGISAGTKEFSPLQLLTIASLIQAEGDPSDFAKISQVIRNRLKVGMPLQLDTTIHYITRTRGKVFLSTNATRIASPYNTYLHYGLPPGPIDNPGRAAMDAAIHPSPGDWIYFITVRPGDTRFTASNSQFLTWKSEYEKNLAAGDFGKTK